MRREVRIGLLFSRSGSYRLIAEAGRLGALRGVAAVNDDPSMPITLRAVERDPAGEADAYAPLCADILATGARHVVGCCTSWSRKEVIPKLERLGGTLWYPCPYEGFEASTHVVYAHACPNQHLAPLLAWALPRHGSRGFLLGSNYIWGWEMSRAARGIVGEAGGAVLGDRTLPLGDADVARLVEEVRATRPDWVLNNLIGPSSYAFLRAYAALGRADPAFAPSRRPVLSCNLSECELGPLGDAAEGLVSAGPYFREEGAAFGSSFEAAAHAAVLSLAARLARSGEDAPLAALLAEDAPGLAPGLAIDPATHHATLPVLIAQVEGGAFRVRERHAAVAPDPYLTRRAPTARPRLALVRA